MDTLKGISSFVRAVEEGSIAGGARRMGISAAAASQNIARLEQQLGNRLLLRTTRRLALTEQGQIYYQHVRGVVQALADAHDALAHEDEALAGKLRIASSAAFGRHVLAPLIAKFAQQHPQLRLELVLADHNVDHLREDIDLSIRFPQQLEPGLVARRIARVPLRCCASPAYLATHGRPQQPEDLIDHCCLLFRVPNDGRLLDWVFIRDGLRFEPKLNTTLVSNDIDSLALMAAAGAGIGRIGAFAADPLIASGQLQALFESAEPKNIESNIEENINGSGKIQTQDKPAQIAQTATNQSAVEIEPLDFYACYPDRHATSAKLRRLLDFLVLGIPDAWKT